MISESISIVYDNFVMKSNCLTRKVLQLALILILSYNLVYAQKTPYVYKVGVGDTLSISILGYSELTEEVTVISDGTIPFHFIGTLYVKGLSLLEIKKHLFDKLSSRYVNYPQIIIKLIKEKTKNFYIYGEVQKPGVYPIEGVNSILKALSMAGITRDTADTSKIKILRHGTDGSLPKFINVNIDRMLERLEVNLDVEIQNGDTIIVNKRWS